MKLTERLKRPIEWLKIGIASGVLVISYITLDKIQQYRLDNSEMGQLMEMVRTSSNPHIERSIGNNMIIYKLDESHPYNDRFIDDMIISVTLEDVPPLNRNSVGDCLYGQNRYISGLGWTDFKLGGSKRGEDFLKGKGITSFLGIPRIPSKNMNWTDFPGYAKEWYIDPLRKVL